MIPDGQITTASGGFNAKNGSNSLSCDQLDDLHRRLIANGYEPIPVNGKRPVIDGWSSGEITVERIRALRETYPDHTNTGLRTSRLPAIDIDLRNRDHAALIEEHAALFLGSTMRRVGSKGVMMPYRIATPIPKITISGMAPGAKIGDKPERVEILCAGQQFVAYGIHPDTGKLYRWLDIEDLGEPLKRPRADLPEVTPERLREFAPRIAMMLTELGYTDVRISDRGDQNRNALVHQDRPEREPVREQDLTAMLRHLDPGVDRLKWIGYIAAIRSTNLKGIDGAEATDLALLDIACAWSRGEYSDKPAPGNYESDDDVTTTFYSLDPNMAGGTHFGTIYHDACEAGFAGWGEPKPDGTSSQEAFQQFAKNLTTANEGSAAHRVRLLRGSDVRPEKIEWLWQGHYARGKMHLRAGTPEAGKNVSAIDTAATLSRTGKWPDGTLAPLGDTIIWSGEDSFRDTTLPRFLAAGGDDRRLYSVRDVVSADGTRRPFDPACDIPDLCALIEANPDLRYVLIDPISTVVGAGRGASHNDAETRRALAPLVELAEARGIVLEGIIHFAKGTAGRTIIERVNGSIAYGAVARVIHAVASFGDGTGPRRFVRAKCNIVKPGGVIGYEFSLADTPIPGYPDHDGQPKVVWGSPLRGTAEELLEGEGRLAVVDEARTFLRTILAEAGAVGISVKDLKAAAEANCHSWRTIERAKEKLPVATTQMIGEKHGGWIWRWNGPDDGAELPF